MLADRARRHAEPLAPLLERVTAVGLLPSAVVLAAQAFMALIPLLIAAVALAPAGVGQTIAGVARQRLGLSGDTGEQVNHLVATRDDLRGTITVLGALVILASATSFTRALQRIYETAWELPRLGLRGSLRGLGWLLGLVAYFALLGLALKLTTSPAVAASALRYILVGLAAFVLWWLTPFILLCGRVRLRALIGTGLLTAVALVIAGAVSAAVMPSFIGSNERQYGTIGVAFAIESWLVVIASIIVGSTIIGAYAAQSDSALGRLARGRDEPNGWRRPSRWDSRG
jgi:membrane protein